MSSANRRRNRQLSFRLSDDELAQFVRKQAASGLNKTAFLMQILNSATIKVFSFNEAIKPLYAELRRIGVNLNQIAYLVNIGRHSEAECELLTMKDEYRSLINRLNEFLDNPLPKAAIKEYD